jgi:hypothetical protein
MPGYDFEDEKDVNNGGPEDESVHDDPHEGDGDGGHDDDHHEGDGSGGHDDDHHKGDIAGVYGGGEDTASTGTHTQLTSALQDPTCLGTAPQGDEQHESCCLRESQAGADGD